jgi:hypothetical protein
MRNKNLQLLSSRVKKTPSTSADIGRYTFLDLKNAEPDAGVPASHTSSRGIFASDTSGTRDWLYADAGLSVDTGTGFITVNENTVFIDTTGFDNSSSNNLADVLFDLDQNLFSLAEQTLESVATDDTVDGNGTTGNPLSIGQGVRYSNSPTFTGLAINASYQINGITLNDPILITTQTSHNMADGDIVFIRDVNGTTELNGNSYYVDVQSANTFTLYSDQALTTTVDGTTGFTAYVNGGFAMGNGYSFPSLDGSDGLYLKTNGFGVLEFDRPIQYAGSQPSVPDIGDLWYDEVTTGDLLIWNGTNWASTTGGGSQGAFTLRQFQGDGTTTAFDTSSPSVNKVLVFLNGILMRLTDDFTYSAGIVTFAQAPQASDTIEVLLTGNASLVGLDLLGIENHDLITVDGSGNVTFVGELDMQNFKIVNLGTPTENTDAATKGYVDSQITSLTTTTDIAGDTGTDTITLGTDVLTFSGTANEIVTAVTNNTVTISLPNSITVDVVGALTGNASTATALATARDFSLTGAVTASAVSFNGTGNVALSTSIVNLPNSSLANSSIDITDGVTTETINLGDAITFADGTDIDVVVSATGTITVNHNVTGANTTITAAANTFVDEITVSAQGHVTNVATTAVDFNVSDNYSFKSITDGTNTAVADSNTDTFKIRSADQIEVTVTDDDVTHGDNLLIGHADSGVTPNTYGSSTAIPVITIDAQGHITSATTDAISTTWTLTDGVTSQNISGGDTLTVTAGADITAVVSATDTLTIANTSTLDSVTGRGATTTNDISVGNITTSGYVRGPATFTIDPAAHGDDTGTVVIAGNLTVNGTTTTVNSETIALADNTIELNSNLGAGTAPSQNAGLLINRGSSTDVEFRWNEGSDEWEITNDGTNYYRLVTTEDNFIADLTAGTGISISHTPSAGSTATISTANIPNSSLTNSSIVITDGVTPQTVDLGETITFADGTDINVVMSATNTLTVNHNVAGANTTISAATNTFVDEITVTAQGHVTSVATSPINWNVSENYAFKTITDGANDAVADSNADTFTVTGTGDITATVNPTTDTLTISFNNSSGYLTAESDTLDTVTSRGATTTNNITVGTVVTDIVQGRTFTASRLSFDYDSTLNGDNSTQLESVAGMQLLFDTNNNDANSFMIGHGSNDPDTASIYFVIDGTGNVGIGTNTPGYSLDVVRSGVASILIGSTGGATAQLILDGNSNGDGSGDDYASIIHDGTSGDLVFRNLESGNIRFQTNSNAERLTILDNGNVGIGTTVPSTKLDVNGDVTITDRIIHAGDTNTQIRFPANDVVSVETNGATRVYISNVGMGLGTVNPQARLDVRGNTDIEGDLRISENIVHLGDTNTRIRFPFGDTVTVETSGAERLRVNSVGNVGIGITAPSEKLHVSGNIIADNIVSKKNGNAAGIYTFQKTIAISGSADIFTIDNSFGAQVFTAMFNCSTSGYSVAKHYTVAHQFNASPVENLTINTGPFSGHDFTVTFTNETGIATGSAVKCAITNDSTAIAATITVTLILGGSPTAVTITEH